MATKTIILVRHGQYHRGEGRASGRLTALGRRQARYVARRLREHQIDRIVHSTMPRAAETASIIQKELKFRGRFQASAKLCECVPGFPRHLRKKYGHTDEKKLIKYKAQAEAAFKRFFTSSRKDSVEVLVCHGNIIRYLICRIVGLNSINWINMDIQHCGICVVEVRTTGAVRSMLISHNDVGHIPKKDRRSNI